MVFEVKFYSGRLKQTVYQRLAAEVSVGQIDDFLLLKQRSRDGRIQDEDSWFLCNKRNIHIVGESPLASCS